MYNDIISKIKSLYPGQDFIPLHEPRFNEKDKAYVMDAIDSTFVSSVGKYVDKFEDMMRDYTGASYAIAAVNGTAALHMSLLIAGVERNDMVITQALSFIATCNAISYIGAEPVFVDVALNTLGMCPDKLKDFLKNETELKSGVCYHKKTGKRISACVPMHTFGHPVAIEAIMELCAEYGIKLVEDAAESIGSTYKGKHTGTFGLIGAFSFNGNKTITCGGGGAIVTNDPVLAKHCKHLTTQAKIPHRWEFNHDHVGYNYRLPNLNAAMACAQMEQLDGFIANKRELAAIYKEFFAPQPIEFIVEPADAKSNYWLNAVLVKDRKKRDEFLTATNEAGVMTRPVWTLMTKLTMFEKAVCGDLSVSQEIEDRLVNIPSSVRIN
ncbi:MAG: putative PLP-dependent enzyme involved in cell wall biosis [Bacteroidetes bacterium]|jgi:perosamine synthetase|nr:putative PLP-dependent enzyme involved in cell wall biosis [Bacteroidota bacterium]